MRFEEAGRVKRPGKKASKQEMAGWKEQARKHNLFQIYLDRWQIEVNHREEKDTLGVGQAQLWNPIWAPRQPVLAVAAYSALLLAGLKAFGAQRTNDYAPLPAWRRKARRPSALDLVALLRKEVAQHPELIAELDRTHSSAHSVAAAAA